MTADPANPTRRAALAAGLAGLAAAAVGAAATREDRAMTQPATTPSARMPAIFLPHGGGPWPFVDLGMDPAENDALAAFLRAVPSTLPAPPRALLVISAHWEASVPTVSTAAKPPMLYDYYGFPPASYQLQWPAPGDPALAARVRALLGEAGVHTAEDGQRGYDHGTFIPLMLAFPEAKIPTVQLSLKAGLDPAEHLAIGRALAPLRDEGVLILGSGMTFHNMRAFRDPRAKPYAERFDAWLREAVVAAPEARDRALTAWAQAPEARICHPREEHLLPLMVVAGAAGADAGKLGYNGTMMGMRHLGVAFG